MTETQIPMNKPRIEIRYCTLCRWMLRAAWLAQELLSTFDSELGEVALVPASKGEFRILVDGVLVWCGIGWRTRASPRPRRSSSGCVTSSPPSATSATRIASPQPNKA